jgi:hypothetical protein
MKVRKARPILSSDDVAPIGVAQRCQPIKATLAIDQIKRELKNV